MWLPVSTYSSFVASLFYHTGSLSFRRFFCYGIEYFGYHFIGKKKDRELGVMDHRRCGVRGVVFQKADLFSFPGIPDIFRPGLLWPVSLEQNIEKWLRGLCLANFYLFIKGMRQ